jgi:hypothetical protein
METIIVSAGAVLEAVNVSGTRQMKASTVADDVEQPHVAVGCNELERAAHRISFEQTVR